MKQQLLLTLSGMLWTTIAFSQPIVKVWGSQDSLAVKELIVQYLDHLDVQENIYLSVGFTTLIPRKLRGMTFCVNSPESTEYQAIKVRIDSRMDEKLQRLVLAHEMIHVKQYAKGELVVTGKQQVLWKGRKYYAVDKKRTPWENEAYRTDNLLVKMLEEQSGTTLTALRTRP